MAGRNIEKFPIVWIGDLVIKNVRIKVKLTYVSGDLKTAINALPKLFPYSSIVLTMRMKSTMSEDFNFEKSGKCVLTVQPYGDTDEETEQRAAALYHEVVLYLRRKGSTGAIAFSKDPKYRMHLYLKSKSSSSILAPLAPDWFHVICDRMYLVMLVSEIADLRSIRIPPTE
ncbi:uncharacterized protein LOC129985137 [Argiope bruennichi]|uniref:Msx2-interacting protein like n=1 Tax=Argiope bruennichi TaxID=94029 RepID=A0A8T0EJI1_ARGBR|nr:uncharacterized protein LOC129985137 [Argiope bruennichi]KAF8773738.1 Msx2-interacting protein like [Argiope bruennichi]